MKKEIWGWLEREIREGSIQLEREIKNLKEEWAKQMEEAKLRGKGD